MQVILRSTERQIELVGENQEEMKLIRDLWVNGIWRQVYDYNESLGYASIIITPFPLAPDEPLKGESLKVGRMGIGE